MVNLSVVAFSNSSSPDAFKLSVWSCPTPEEYQWATCQKEVPKAISCLWIQLQLSWKSNECSLFGHTPFDVNSLLLLYKQSSLLCFKPAAFKEETCDLLLLTLDSAKQQCPLPLGQLVHLMIPIKLRFCNCTVSPYLASETFKLQFL